MAKRAIALLALLAICPAWTFAKDPATHPANAADEYRLAFAGLVGTEGWPALNEMSDDVVPALAESVREPVLHLHRAAAMERCDWGLDYSQGFELKLPHLNAARRLAAAGIVLARDCRLKNRPGDAYQIMDDLMRLGQDVDGRFLASGLVACNIRHLALTESARHLPGTPADVIATFAARVNDVHDLVSVADTMKSERDAAVSSVRKAMRNAQALQNFYDLLHSDGDQTDLPAWTALSKDSAALEAAMKELTGLFDLETRECALAPKDWDAGDIEFSAAHEKAGMLSKAMIPTWRWACETRLESQIQLTMLRCGIAIEQKGESELKNFKDPFDGGQFDLKKIEGGFVLSSKFIRNKKTVSLVFGTGNPNN